MSGELIALIANLALTLSFIVAVIAGIAQVKAANRDRRERLLPKPARCRLFNSACKWNQWVGCWQRS